MAHQYTAQLVTKESSNVRDSIFGNVGTMIVFRVGADDADFLEKEFMPEFTPEDIVNLPNYKIYLKLMIGGVTSRPFSARTLPPLVKSGNLEIEEEVIRSSRELYCRSREDVEKEINDWSGMSLGDDNSQGGVEKFEAQCSICKNQTKVPFKPEPGRPVYCKDCITKIKAGEIKPVKVSLKQTKDEQVEFFKPLAVLGIEFPSNQIDEKIENKNYNKINQNRYSINKKPSIFSNIKKVFNKTENIKPKRIMGENLALREVLNKSLEQNKIKEEEEKSKRTRKKYSETYFSC